MQPSTTKEKTSMVKSVNPKLFLFGAFGHLLCWLGGDLLL